MTSRLDNVQQQLGLQVSGASRSYGSLVLELARADLLPVVQRLKTEFAFDLLLDVTAVDWPLKTPRFEVVYHLYSTQHHDRVRIKTAVELADPAVESLV